MTVIREHDLTGTAGTAVTTANGGFDVVTGTVTYVSDGYAGTGAQFTTGANYVQDNIAPGFYGAYWKVPTLPGAEINLDRITDSGGATVAVSTMTPDGKLHIWSSFSTAVAATTTAVTAGQYFRIERQISAAGQTLRLFTDPTANTPTETISGATSGGTPAKYLYGFSWAAHNTGTLNIDTITLADDWPNMGTATPTPTRWMRVGGAWVPATIKARIGGAWVAMSNTAITPPAGDTFPLTFPATLA